MYFTEALEHLKQGKVVKPTPFFLYRLKDGRLQVKDYNLKDWEFTESMPTWHIFCNHWSIVE